MRYKYHDAGVASFRLGPRHELVLQVVLDAVWNPLTSCTIELRCGAIGNYSEVSTFCMRTLSRVVSPGAFLDTIDSVSVTNETCLISFSESGCLLIRTSKIQELPV
ncbi:hypothetical protein GCM10023186_40020 [Hymenobacter koreensis]|uniref:Uncharacterized protein n=1 Tax=Hymenobacter koreensis TaxID=1084523 RepID=A0ABP8JI02_9BACT